MFEFEFVFVSVQLRISGDPECRESAPEWRTALHESDQQRQLPDCSGGECYSNSKYVTWCFMPSQYGYMRATQQQVSNLGFYDLSTTWCFTPSQQLDGLRPVNNLVFYAQSTTWCFTPSQQLGVLCPVNNLVFCAQSTTWCFVPSQQLGVLCPASQFSYTRMIQEQLQTTKAQHPQTTGATHWKPWLCWFSSSSVTMMNVFTTSLRS